MKTTITIILFLSLFSCKTKEKIQTNKNIEQTTETYISLFRSGCYGKCPVYKLTIYKDGSFKYIGKSNVKKIGDHSGKITDEQSKNLFESLQNYNWNSYLAEYAMDNSDFPSFTIEYANGKTIKKIKGNSNAPKELIELTKSLDKLLSTYDY